GLADKKTEGRAGSNRDGSRALRRRATAEPATTAVSVTFFHPDLSPRLENGFLQETRFLGS
ncbi:MAG: hypothetical protein HY740_09660, partial [Chloroflexi bacterium]|nr:hypothetical protein [Chloroflexota bacterium]